MDYELLLPVPRRDIRGEGGVLPLTSNCDVSCPFYLKIGDVEMCTYNKGFRFLVKMNPPKRCAQLSVPIEGYSSREYVKSEIERQTRVHELDREEISKLVKGLNPVL